MASKSSRTGRSSSRACGARRRGQGSAGVPGVHSWGTVSVGGGRECHDTWALLPRPQSWASTPTSPFSWYLVEFGQHGPRLLLLLILLHLGLQPPVVLQGLLPPFHRHVEAREDAAEPARHSPGGSGPSVELQPRSSGAAQTYTVSAREAPDPVPAGGAARQEGR